MEDIQKLKKQVFYHGLIATTACSIVCAAIFGEGNSYLLIILSPFEAFAVTFINYMLLTYMLVRKIIFGRKNVTANNLITRALLYCASIYFAMKFGEAALISWVIGFLVSIGVIIEVYLRHQKEFIPDESKFIKYPPEGDFEEEKKKEAEEAEHEWKRDFWEESEEAWKHDFWEDSEEEWKRDFWDKDEKNSDNNH